jgi:hypothetical protein
VLARRALGFVAIALPAAAAATLVVRFGVDVPNWDEWLFVPFLERVAHGEATLGDWLAPHNDHVVLVPRVLLAGLAFTFGWNIWFGLFASLLFTAGTTLTLFRLRRPAAAGDPSLLLAGDAATALLLFSLVQVENWLWGMQSAWFFANLCVALALLALRPSESPPSVRRIALAAGACFVATLTTAQGPFAWLAMVPLVAWGSGRVRERRGAIVVWLCLTAAAWVLLLLTMREARHASSTEEALRDPLAAARFFFALLGAPLAPAPDLAVALGVLLFLAVLGLGVAGLRQDRSAALPWCSLGAFGMMVAAATALGRVGFGIDYALTSRYTTNAVLVWIAAWHLARLQLQRLRSPAARATTLALLAGLVVGLGATSRWAIEIANTTRLSLSGAKACLELGSLLEPTRLNEGPMIYLYMHPAGARRRFDTLVEMGVRQARPRPSFDRTADGRLGMITPPPRLAVEKGTVTGWTAVEDREHPPILLLSANDGRSFVAAQQLVEGVSPLGVRVRFRTGTVAEWEIPLGANGPGPDTGPVSAWRFDPGPNRISRLASRAP